MLSKEVYMKRIFGSLKMNYLSLILFAVITGLYTGLILLVSPLKDTSFQDIGISYEWWVLFAVILVVNCHKGTEAMFKCFLFFLISQPLVYIVQILAGDLSFEMGLYYYKNIWLPMTCLTLPGGFIAYFCKKQNLLGAVILGLGNTIQAFLGISYLAMAMHSFPRHLLSALFCFGSIILMSFNIQKEKKNRLVSILLPALLTLLLLIFLKVSGRVLF